MTAEGLDWFDDLLLDIRDFRRDRPLASRDALSPEEEMQCRIIGGNLISWLEQHGPLLMQQRSMLAKLNDCWEEPPFVVFTSNQPGLVAATEIIRGMRHQIACLFPEEFSSWLKKHPDPDNRWHVHTWSYFTPLDKEIVKLAKAYPIAPGECYWLHKEGSQCGNLFGRGGDHLWKWDGHEAVLLEEGIRQWVS